jgi:hypothetical protein
MPPYFLPFIIAAAAGGAPALQAMNLQHLLAQSLRAQ